MDKEVNNMTFDEKILAYEQSDKDRILTDIAQTIIEAYNGSYKPHIIQNLENITTKHTTEGYSLLKTEQEHLSEPKTWVLTTDENISDFIEHSFLVLGKTSVKWKDVIVSKAVSHALENKYYEASVFDFDKLNAFPIIDCGDNDFAVYLRNDDCFAKINIVDGTIFKKRKDLAELIGGINE